MARKMKTMDGNTAAAYVSYAFTEVAGIYPITPSSTMAELVDEWSAKGQKNIFGETVDVIEMQSEAGAAGVVHGSLAAGALTTTYTASQGLLLMIPNMYKMAGELLPAVFHVSARAIAGHALSIFGDHSDVMSARQTGFAMLASNSVQEVMDLGGIAHLSAIKTRVPFLHFFDGFRTSHEVQKIEQIEYDEFAQLLDFDKVQEFRDRALNPEHPVTRGTAQNPDIFFQAKEALNPFYTDIPDIVADYMKEITKLTGREYKPFDYYGAEDATHVLIAMGSVVDTIEETVDYLVAKGEKVGVIKVRLYRPFSEKYFFDVLPKTVERIAVLDRCKEMGAPGEPLYEDVRSMFYDKEMKPIIVGGRYGLGSKDTTPPQIVAAFDNLKNENPKNGFTLGIVDDVTFTSLETTKEINTTPEGTIRCKFWGLGSDGTVGANKNSIKIIGDETDLYAQGYFSYDSKKSGGVTISHLRFGKKPIKSTYLIDEADFVSCSTQAYVNQYDLLKGLKKGGSFLLNTVWSEEELNEKLPADLKKYIAENNIEFYIINATKIAEDLGLGNRTNTIMQSAFFKLAKVIDLDDAVKYMKEAVVKSYGSKGEAIVNMNHKAIDAGIESLHKVNVPADWSSAEESGVQQDDNAPDFIKNVLRPMNRQEGDSLPVSTFTGREDGTFPLGTAAYEKRGIAVNVPEWQIDNCIQCNQCSFVCPHAAIRPFLITEEEMVNAPEGFAAKKPVGKGLEGYQYKIQVSVLDCTGCGNCADICPSKEKSLIMKPIGTQSAEIKNWEYAASLPVRDKILPTNNVKGSQFVKPLFEFSGACAGCGETPYARVITQLYGDRMMIANATGCSSIWGGSAPSTPYCTNSEGKGPSWANSLFEDNAEYGFGMAMAVKKNRQTIENALNHLVDCCEDASLKSAAAKWIENKKDGEGSKVASVELLGALDNVKTTCSDCQKSIQTVLNLSDFLVKKSVWAFGGDGWAYDIGYGGLDHVIASGEDINIMVFDTEVYSNTGGQASKATPVAAVAKFAASGMKNKKKDLGLMAMTYGNVYVAQVGMGSDKNQFMKALMEAESYDGPSVLIAYSPCINHGIKGGMGKAQEQIKNAVETGYWHLYRYNPMLKEEGKNPFVLDSKEPTKSFQDFIRSEVRYTSLQRSFPGLAEKLFEKAEQDAKNKYEIYRKLSETQIL
ncbi:pyruvate:ferredoxin (flavodoxin) oxidoreductase [Alkalibacter rhizosphaerae]|uniref:Pyruvate:ferredoxin oxidoreductase n=1 Tax=Alkalibacter rhizosphaerae TaxID=2815577 RepID=A0A974XH64_9FIRM|nr:pyruvate:ferredoxin (flavodoxin) oxidoreductase [Alkalibacter rhizosphaerae]QSX08570.1 pyruvate:ferredoxin (flavodoxin) oxidoreductase [Alkalibacter rhizosphaerae]